MTNIVPILKNCNIGKNGRDNILVMDLPTYLRENPDLSFPHRHNFYHFLLFTNGEGSFTIDFTNFTIEPYTLYFMIPGQVHTWSFKNNPQGYICNFSVDFFQSLLLRMDYLQQFPFLNGIVDKSVLQVPSKLRNELCTLLDEAKLAIQNPGEINQDLIAVILLHFFLKLEDYDRINNNTNISSTHQLLLTSFKRLIEENFMNEKFPKYYADKLNVSPNHLNSVCKQSLGLSAGEVIRQRIILEAKRLLINPRITVSALADELDFNDNSYFTKFFKKATDLTPEEFRKKNQIYGI